MSVDDFLKGDFMNDQEEEVCPNNIQARSKLIILRKGSGSEEEDDDDAASFASVDDFDGTPSIRRR